MNEEREKVDEMIALNKKTGLENEELKEEYNIRKKHLEKREKVKGREDQSDELRRKAPLHSVSNAIHTTRRRQSIRRSRS